jgi:hypothetical protein
MAETPQCPCCKLNDEVDAQPLTQVWYHCGRCYSSFEHDDAIAAPITDHSLTLRDRIMLAVLPALIGIDSQRRFGTDTGELVRCAYDFADAGIAVRNEPKESA